MFTLGTYVQSLHREPNIKPMYNYPLPPIKVVLVGKRRANLVFKLLQFLCKHNY